MTTTSSIADARASHQLNGALRSVLASTARPNRPGPVTVALVFGWRGILKIRHVPEQLIDVTITPVLFVLMFTYMFGGALAGSTGEYLEYLLPGILAMSVLFTTVYSGVSLNTDATKGVVDRIRTLPIWKAGPLVGAVMGDSVRYLIAGTLIIVLGVILGYRPEGGPVGVVAALALVIAFAFSLSWVFTTMGLLLRSPSAVMNAGFMALFPITFVSNAFVNPDTMPSWLEVVVRFNPISRLISANRGLMGGNIDAGEIVIALAVAAGLTVVFAPLTTYLYRNRS